MTPDPASSRLHDSARSLPPLLEMIGQHDCPTVGAHSVLDFRVYEVDLSSYRLALSDRTPFLFIPSERVTDDSLQDLALDVRDALDQIAQRSSDARIAVVCLGERASLELKPVFRWNIASTAALVSGEDEDSIVSARNPASQLLAVLVRELPSSLLSPYCLAGPVTGARFFGRSRELRFISESRHSFAVVGARRIGKSSLLRELLRRSTRESEWRGGSMRAHFVDCAPMATIWDFAHDLVLRTEPQALRSVYRLSPAPVHIDDCCRFITQHIRKLAANALGQVILLIDEADQLMLADRKDWPLLRALRSLVGWESLRVVLAGSRLLQEALHDKACPIFNLAEPLALQPFARGETAELILGPLRALRIKINRAEELVDRIYLETGGHPNLIQFYCRILLDSLELEGKTALTPDDLQTVHSDVRLRRQVTETVLENLDRDAQACLLAMAGEPKCDNGVEIEELQKMLRSKESHLSASRLRGAVRDLVDACVLASRGGSLTYVVPILPKLLREHLGERRMDERLDAVPPTAMERPTSESDALSALEIELLAIAEQLKDAEASFTHGRLSQEGFFRIKRGLLVDQQSAARQLLEMIPEGPTKGVRSVLTRVLMSGETPDSGELEEEIRAALKGGATPKWGRKVLKYLDENKGDILKSAIEIGFLVARNIRS